MQVVKTLWLQVYSRCELTITQDKSTCQNINRFLVLGCVMCVCVSVFNDYFCFLAHTLGVGITRLVIYGQIPYD